MEEGEVENGGRERLKMDEGERLKMGEGEGCKWRREECGGFRQRSDEL